MVLFDRGSSSWKCQTRDANEPIYHVVLGKKMWDWICKLSFRILLLFDTWNKIHKKINDDINWIRIRNKARQLNAQRTFLKVNICGFLTLSPLLKYNVPCRIPDSIVWRNGHQQNGNINKVIVKSCFRRYGSRKESYILIKLLQRKYSPFFENHMLYLFETRKHRSAYPAMAKGRNSIKRYGGRDHLVTISFLFHRQV